MRYARGNLFSYTDILLTCFETGICGLQEYAAAYNLLTVTYFWNEQVPLRLCNCLGNHSLRGGLCHSGGGVRLFPRNLNLDITRILRSLHTDSFENTS